ncbi:hypothetical protein J4422_04125 [Candidatus Pacearchaeota archaeon]|nr:hypothetical protein [Candidatus Pacearchaeota archaeon]
MAIKVSFSDLESRIKSTLKHNPNDTVELSDLSRDLYVQLKVIFEREYEVMGIINVNDKESNYILHIRRK